MNLSMLSVESVRETTNTERAVSASSGLRVRTDARAGATNYDTGMYANGFYRR